MGLISDTANRSIIVDPTTNTPLDPAKPTPVAEADCLAFSGSKTDASVIVPLDLDGYESVSVQVTSFSAGSTLIAEFSEDNQTFVGAIGLDIASAQGVPRSTITGTGIYRFARMARFFRIRCSTYAGGAPNSVVGHLSKAPQTAPYMRVSSQPKAQDTTGFAPTNDRIHSAASTNTRTVKNSLGVLNHLYVANDGASAAFVKLYNKISSPNLASDVPLLTFRVPAGGHRDIAPPAGIAFPAGIAIAITGGAADTDTTAVAAAQVTGTLGYS